jgi:hypothetical protein
VTRTSDGSTTAPPIPPRSLPETSARTRKLRQAAFAYLHVGILYESAVLVMAQRGLLPAERGPVWLWLAIGAVIVGVIFWGLWFKELVWLARIVWALHALRLPTLISGAFFPAAQAAVPPSFYVVALAVVLVNLWMLARAGWDL